MIIQELLNYKITSYKNHTFDGKSNFMIIFGIPQSITDEGSFFRIGNFHIIKKYGIEEVNLKNSEQVVSIQYKNGNVIVLGICFQMGSNLKLD